MARVIGAGKEYQAGDTLITALHPSSMDLRSGELTLIIGPSGSGKTTLLSLLGCVLYPSFGEVWIDGIKANELNEKELAGIRLRKIGFVLGMLLLEGFRRVVSNSGLLFSFSPAMMLAMFGVISLISLGGASFALGRIRKVEPAAVFR